MLLFTVRHAKKSGILVPVVRGFGGRNTGQPSEGLRGIVFRNACTRLDSSDR